MESCFGITENSILSNKNLNFLLRYIYTQNDVKLNTKSHRHRVFNFFLIDLWIIFQLQNSCIPYLETYLRLLLPYEASRSCCFSNCVIRRQWQSSNLAIRRVLLYRIDKIFHTTEYKDNDRASVQ